MMTPLTRPTAAAPPMAATRPMRTEGKRGTPAVERRSQRQRREHRGEAHDPADREINAGGDDDEGLTEAEQQHRNDRDQNVLRVAHGEEIDRAACRQRHGDDEEQDEKSEEQPRPDAAQKQNDPLRPRASPGGRGRRAGEGHPRGAFGHRSLIRRRSSSAHSSSAGRRRASAPSPASSREKGASPPVYRRGLDGGKAIGPGNAQAKRYLPGTE